MKGILIILDGLADLPHPDLKNKTPLEISKTPHLDFFSNKGKIDYCYTVKEGVAPQSHNAVISLLGFDPNSVPRGPLEALGAKINLKNGDLSFRTNFGTITDLKTGEILDRRAGRTLTTKEAKILARAINDSVKLKHPFEFHATNQHRGVLIFRGGFSDNITNVDPGYQKGLALVSHKMKLRYSHPVDDEDDSQLSSELVNKFVRHSHNVLDNHPINIQRAKNGLHAANIILCRDPGNSPPRLKKLKGKWMALGYMPLEIGIARATKMDIYQFRYPKMKGTDIYKTLYSGLNKAIKYAIRMIKRNHKKYDYFYVHFKETDIPGHDNKPLDKIKMMEILDQRFFSFLQNFIPSSNPLTKVVLTADHTTACKLKSHTDDPVPVLTYPHPKQKSNQQRFTEKQGLKGRKILARKLLDTTLFSKSPQA